MERIRLRRLVGVLLLTVGPLAVRAADFSEAQAYLQDGRLDDAMQVLDALLAADPGEPRARFTRGLVLVRQGRQDEAIQVFKDLAVDFPELPEPYNNLAVLFAAKGDYDAARDALLAAIQTHPSYATAHENLGDIYARMAAAAYDKALSLDQSNRGAQAKLALVNELVTAPANHADSAPVATPVLAKHTDAVPPAATGAGEPRQQAEDAVRAWAEHWSRQDIAAYLDSYAADFEVPAGLDRSTWEYQRRVRLAKPDYIQVDLANLSVTALDGDRYLASFDQVYRSNSYEDQVHKQLLLKHVDGAWKIQREVSESR